MAAPKGKEALNILFNEIIIDISEGGKSLISSIKNRMSISTFYELIENDVVKSNRYTRATELRADLMAEDALNIADCLNNDIIKLDDGKEIENQRVIARDRLRVDTRKWLLAKLHPKKYGEKLSTDLTTNGKDLIQTVIILPSNNRDEKIKDE